MSSKIKPVVMQFTGQQMYLSEFVKINIEAICSSGVNFFGDHPALRDREALCKFVKEQFQAHNIADMFQENFAGAYTILERNIHYHICLKIFGQISVIAVHYIHMFMDVHNNNIFTLKFPHFNNKF